MGCEYYSPVILSSVSNIFLLSICSCCYELTFYPAVKAFTANIFTSKDVHLQLWAIIMNYNFGSSVLEICIFLSKLCQYKQIPNKCVPLSVVTMLLLLSRYNHAVSSELVVLSRWSNSSLDLNSLDKNVATFYSIDFLITGRSLHPLREL